MLEDVGDEAKAISRMSKLEIIAAIIKINPETETSKLSRKALEVVLRDELGYKPTRPAINGGTRRAAIEKKVQELQTEREDTARIRAEAEKHYLGIALSCSPADDAETDRATATCLDVAKSPNGAELTVLGIIDLVKHTKTKRGKNPGSPMCFLTISDSTYSLDHAVVFPKQYEELKTRCKEGLIVLATGQKNEGSFIIDKIRVLI
jgi:DNA polymerase III alpha subunit